MLTHSLKEERTNSAEDILDAQDINYQFVVAEHLKGISLGAGIRRGIYLIFEECVNNLAKYSGSDKTLIEGNIENIRLSLKLLTTGTVDQAQSLNGKSNGFGDNCLPNVERCTAILGGQFYDRMVNREGNNGGIESSDFGQEIFD